jgi:predicted RND superfamily exporter protein
MPEQGGVVFASFARESCRAMRVLSILLRRRRLVVFLHIALALVMVPGVLQLENDNSPEVFFARDTEALQSYQRFVREFGGGPAVRVALGGRGLWTKQGLAWLSELEERAASLPGVEAAVGLAAQHRWLLLEWPPPDPEAFRDQVLEKGLDLGAGWVSPEGDIITMLVVLADLSPATERKLLHRLDALVSKTPPGIRAHLSGLPVLHLAMDRSLVVMASRFLPLLVLLAAAFLAFIFRCLQAVTIPLIFVGVCQTILFGVMGYVGARINLVNIILAPLLFVITLATAVHLLVRFRDLVQRGLKVPMAVLSTYRSKGRPVLWTGFTTLVAFGSLVTGSVPPIRSVGAWSAVGIAVMTALAFTFYPVLLAGTQSRAPQPTVRPFELRARRQGRTWALWAVLRRSLVLTAAAAVFTAALLGVARLQVEDNPGKYFPEHHPVRAELERLQQHGVGVYSTELILSYPGINPSVKGNTSAQGGEEAGFLNPYAQQRLAHLSGRLRSEPLVYGAVSSGDLVEASIRSLLVEGEVNDSIRWMALGLFQTVPESRKLLHALVSADGKSARVTLLVPMLSFNQMQPLFKQVKSEAARVFPDAEIRVTGQYPLILLAQGKLLRGLIISLSVTLLCVALVFRLLLRSTRLTLRVLVPNLWPVALVLGGMGWLNVPLDSASVMTASIVLGLAVDDTLHTLGHYLRLVPRFGSQQAIIRTLERTAPAHILTSLILVAGFAFCSLSDLLPVSRTGALSAVAIFLALVGDLLLVPALLARTPRPSVKIDN